MAGNSTTDTTSPERDTETPEEATTPVTEETPEQSTDAGAKEGAAETPEEGGAAEATEATEQATDDDTEGIAPENLQQFFDEFEENGSLADESYEALAKMGFSRDVVDAYSRGATSVTTEADADALIESVGGTNQFEAMRSWAGENLSDAELETFNNALGMKSSAQMAMTWLGDRFRAAEGFDAKVTLEGGEASAKSADVYASKAEMTAAMRKVGSNGRRLYGYDSDYTRAVEEKVGRSKLFS